MYECYLTFMEKTNNKLCPVIKDDASIKTRVPLESSISIYNLNIVVYRNTGIVHPAAMKVIHSDA